MDRIEMVERLREKAGVSYEEAKAALEASDWDLLDAVVMLEKQGKVRDAGYSTKRTTSNEQTPPEYKTEKPKGDGFENFMAWVGRVIRKGNRNSLVIMHNNEQKFRLPVTAVVIIALITHIFALVAIIVSLFCGFHYKFVGPELGKDSINDAMGKATKAAESIKDEFKEGAEETRREAKVEAEEIRREANAEAEEIRREAKAEMDELKKEIIDEIDEIKREVDREF